LELREAKGDQELDDLNQVPYLRITPQLLDCLDFTSFENKTFFTTGKKIKDFQFCLPILPAYLSLKFPNGQFPLKTPGPNSPTTLEQNQKKNFFYTWWGLHVGGKGVLL
jgi:hypothetical protein